MKPPTKSPPGSAPPGPVETPPEKRRSILLVDDHPFMRAGLAQLIDRQPDLMVGGEAGNPAEAVRLLGAVSVDLVLSDITMPGRSGLEFIKDLQATHPGLPILVVSMHDEMLYAERVLRAGARGYIMKESGGENLLEAIRLVLAGKVYISPRVSAKIVDDFSARKPRGSNSPIEQLTDREFEVFQLVGQGKTTREIARHLGISPKTADVHRGRIKEKLGLTDSTALVRHAVRWVETQNDGG
jgi:DNA-binding NarL/FixJ family response regulator